LTGIEKLKILKNMIVSKIIP